jgi:hypothetical protein
MKQCGILYEQKEKKKIPPKKYSNNQRLEFAQDPGF